MGTTKSTVSTALQAAQARLLRLQAESAARRQQQTTQSDPLPVEPSASAPAPLQALPPHLGWESDRVTHWLRAREVSSEPAQAERQQQVLAQPEPQVVTTDIPPAAPPTLASHIRLYPSLALAWLRQNQESLGRIWLLGRLFDHHGRGWLPLKQFKQKLTDKKSAYRICGGRRWRQLLRQGEGIFWVRNNGRLWLRAPSKVALACHVEKLTGQPIALPTEILWQKLQLVRAHFYASFHSSRGAKGTAGPIARETLTELTGLSAQSQRAYEQLVGIKREENIVIGPPVNEERVEELGWEHGRAMFIWQDHEGKWGPAGQAYIAWQLPNSYNGPHQGTNRGRQKHINRTLTDLFMQGITGNGEMLVNTLPEGSRYHYQAKTAVRHQQQAPEQQHYWCSRRQQRRRTVWHAL
ncbi:MAG TPA: hypothetical protein VLL52_07235 [Anaerolineae bacterium]|nr:hypothetical protein [Anaerolineae bacterium]